MSGLFFGARVSHLFGYYHPPSDAASGSVLLCYPWGTEYQFAHRAIRVLARRLARKGRHVLRFDYSGTGDSWGETTEADLDVWLDDVRRAADELRAIGGFEKLDVIGLRLGATVAAMARRRLGPMGSLVLWDPIIDGEAWLEEIQGHSPSSGSSPVQEGQMELNGQTVSERFGSQLAAIRSPRLDGRAGRALLLTTTGPPRDRTRVPATDALSAEHLPQPSPWIEDIAVGSGRIPVEAINRIVAWIAP